MTQFKELHTGDVRGIASLTEDEYKYATQIAVWASCGQLSVPGTSFTAGRAALVEPTADAQQICIYDSIKAMLRLANGWTKNLYTGMYLRAEEDQDVRGVEIIHERGLEGAATDHENGIQKERINGKEYSPRRGRLKLRPRPKRVTGISPLRGSLRAARRREYHCVLTGLLRNILTVIINLSIFKFPLIFNDF